MTTKALGLIETIGLVAAFEAADSALKAANVRLLGYENTKGGGRITLKLVGDVGAVKAAVAAGTAAAQRVGRVESCLVIPRPHQEIESLIGQIDRGPAAVAAVSALTEPAISKPSAPAKPKAPAAAPAPAKAKAAKPKAASSKAKPAPRRQPKPKSPEPAAETESVKFLEPPISQAPVEEPLPPAEPEAPQARSVEDQSGE